MRLGLHAFLLRPFLGILLASVLSASAAEHPANLDGLADQLGKEISKANLKSVAVADLLTADGKRSDLGWYFANRLSDSWLERNHEFRVLDRAELKDTRVSADDLRSAEALKRIGFTWGVDSIVTGNVDISPGHCLFTATARRVADGAVIATASQPIPHSRILDLLSPRGLDTGDAHPLQTAGVKGIGVPQCVYCPIPQYSDKARRARLQSTVVLSITISTDGQAARIAILRDPGYGLTDKAIESVSEWRFRPAMDKDGKPVPVAVPIEVTFRLSRS
jgi:TonB family protein